MMGHSHRKGDPMQPARIKPQMTILEVTEQYPSTILVFMESGFPKIGDPERRKAQGRALTIEAAAKLRQLDLRELLQKLAEAADRDREQADVTLGGTEEMTLLPPGDVRLSGLLPCPVRLPVLEAVQKLADRLLREQGQRLGWSLSAAAVGADGLNQAIARAESEEDLPEVFISAGFESFFDHRTFRRFRQSATFVDLAPPGQNAAFGDLALRDPERRFTMLGVVPAVFLINRNLLGEDPAPRTWEDILHPRFAGRLALPVGDFDLFNGLLLTLFQRFGEDAIRALARNMLAARHPAETVGRFSSRQAEQPAVSIIPYFFSKMTLRSQVIQVVWPEDGAIVSPIFMLVKRSALPLAGEVANLFLSREMGEIIAHRGLMPVLHPEVDNRLPPGSRFRFVGWDFIRDMDFGALIPELGQIFATGAGTPGRTA
jgi:ABC-type Fe3+ transport system substrate-binding protein